MQGCAFKKCNDEEVYTERSQSAKAYHGIEVYIELV
ncbi:MAG: hypothetical protein ACI9Y7_003162 [Dokdonia sp.]|jgi:hypothetical protein